MPSYPSTNYRSYDRSMEMLGHSMMLATISEEQLEANSSFHGSSFQTLGLKRSSALSKSYKTGLAALSDAAAQAHHKMMSRPSQQPAQDDAWGFFMDDE